MGALLAGGLPGLLNQSSAQVIDGSLKFDKTSSTYLTRTPASAGNRKTWTWSGWLKRASSSASNKHPFYGAYGGSDATSTMLAYDNSTDDTIRFEDDFINGDLAGKTPAVFRDFGGGWYHVVISLDTTKSSVTDGLKIYVNGTQQTGLTNTIWNQNHDSNINSTVAQYLGSDTTAANRFFDGQMSQVYFIDGQALGPGYFGFTDPLTNTWRPKKFRAEGTTVNDGTVWSGGWTGTVMSGYNYTESFDGILGTDANNSTRPDSNQTITWTNPKGSTPFETLRLWCINDGGSAVVRVNGIDVTNQVGDAGYSNAEWYTITNVGKSLSSIQLVSVSGHAPFLWGVEVDGVTMVDSTTTNLSFGTNGFYLPMDGNSPIGEDKSGNGNNWTAVNFSGTSIDPDVLKDSPSGAISGGRAQTGITTTSSAPSNYCTMNPLDNGGLTLANGNLDVTMSTSAWRNCRATIGMTTGKWYFEVECKSSTSGQGLMPGILNAAGSITTTVGANSGGYAYNAAAGQKYNNNSGSSYGASFDNGDTISVAYDGDNGTITFYKNGVSQGVAFTSIPSDTYFPAVAMTGTMSASINFGQKPFKFPPPQGFLPLNSASATPETVITRPNQYMNTVTYTGTGSDLTLDVGFKPDLSYFSVRSATGYIKYIFDSVRGATKYLATSHTQGDDAEGTSSSTLKSFNANGVTIGNNAQMNENSSNTWVSWHWKAGGSKNTFNVDDVGYASAAAAGLTGGNITPTGASVGTKQGFSIIKYTGNGNNSAQGIPHGLGKTPSFVMTKALEATGDVMNWRCYHQSLGATQYIQLNTIDAPGTFTDWANTSPTSQYFYVGGTNNTQPANEPKDYISYFWSDIPGLQKFGKFIGNASADGNFIELGFRPALVWIKPLYSYNGGASIIAQTGWYIYDNKRESFNPNGKVVAANANYAEEDNSTDVDFLSNGFKLRNTRAVNTSSGAIYCAWAEAPTFNLYGGQSNAR